MKKFFLIIMVACLSVTTIRSYAVEPTKKMLTIELEKYLAAHGDLCVGKFDWPIDVTQHDVDVGTRDAVQMPVLEKLGLVESSMGSILRKYNDDIEKTVTVKRYALTDAGKKFYVTKEMSSLESSGKTIVHHGDLCVATLSLNKVVRWDKPILGDDHQELTATYTYKIAAVDWSRDPEIQKVFPMVARIIKGEKTMELKQRLRLMDKTWVAVAL